jgi:hypothetical protein
MISWQTVGVLVAIVAAFSGVVIVAFKAFAAATAQGMRGVDEASQTRAAALETRVSALALAQAGQERALLSLRSELPVDYVRKADFMSWREEWILSTSVIDRKIDRLTELVGRLMGERNAR